MKSRYFFALLLLLSTLTFDSFAQQIDKNKVEQDLGSSYHKILYWGNYYQKHKGENNTPNDHDSLTKANEALKQKLKDYSLKYPRIIGFNINSAINSDLHIQTSDDKKFRIYSWNTMTSGKSNVFENLADYIDGDKAFVTTIRCDRAGNPGYFYSKIYTLNANGKTYYLVVFNGINSAKSDGEGIQIFTIENGKLDDDVKLIKTATGLHNKLYYDYDFEWWDSHDELLDAYIRYDSLSKTILLPVVLANGQVTKQMITYRFNGQYFEKVR